MFESRKDLQAKLTAQEAEITRLETELVASQELVNESAGKDQQIAELTEDLEAAKGELTTEQESHEVTKGLLSAEQEKTTPEAIQLLVANEIAGTGHDPIPVGEAGEPVEAVVVSDADLTAKYEKATAQELIALSKSDPETYARLRAL